jgi:hypothetical protein
MKELKILTVFCKVMAWIILVIASLVIIVGLIDNSSSEFITGLCMYPLSFGCFILRVILQSLDIRTEAAQKYLNVLIK